MGQEHNISLFHHGKAVLINYTTQVVAYWRNYLAKEKFREWYNRSKSSSRDPSTSDRNQGESLYLDNAQGLEKRKEDLLADYYGPEDPGRNPAFMVDEDEKGNRIMITQIDEEQADVLFDSRGPLRARTWRDRTYADIPRDIQGSFMQQDYSLWLSYEDTPYGQSWIKAARSEELH